MTAHPYQDYDWGNWTDWRLLSTLNSREIASTPGAYVVAAARPIARALAVDPDGFLDIGETGKGGETLQRRLGKFRHCATTPGLQGHMAGWRYAFFCMAHHFPYEMLRIRWIEAKTKKEAHAYEGRLMLTYMLRHGELPPLNYKFNWTAFGDRPWLTIDEFMNASLTKP